MKIRDKIQEEVQNDKFERVFAIVCVVGIFLIIGLMS